MNKLIDGQKNCVFYVCGNLGIGDSKLVVSFKELTGQPKSVRLEGLLYAFEIKANLISAEITIPLAGRGKLTFEEFHALPLTKDIYIEGQGQYFLMLDLEKL